MKMNNFKDEAYLEGWCSTFIDDHFPIVGIVLKLKTENLWNKTIFRKQTKWPHSFGNTLNLHMQAKSFIID